MGELARAQTTRSTCPPPLEVSRPDVRRGSRRQAHRAHVRAPRAVRLVAVLRRRSATSACMSVSLSWRDGLPALFPGLRGGGCSTSPYLVSRKEPHTHG